MKKTIAIFFMLLTYQISVSQEFDFPIRDKSIRAAEAFGYCLAVEYSLNKIITDFPEQRIEVIRINSIYISTFGNVLSNSKLYFKETFGEEKALIIEKEISNPFIKNLDNTTIALTKDDASMYLLQLEKQLKGNIKSPLIENLLSFQYQDAPNKEITSGYTNVYNTKGHIKAKNAEWQIKTPKSWRAKEGDGANIIQKFIYDCGNSSTMIMMMTNELQFEGINELLEDELNKVYNEILVSDYAKNLMPAKGKLVSFDKMTIAGCPGAHLVFDVERESLGIKMKMRTFLYVFLNRNYMHFLQCSVGSTNINENVEILSKKFISTFKLVANTIKVIEKKNNIIYLEGDNFQKKINVKIFNKDIDFILDTGASVSLISKDEISDLIKKGKITSKNYLNKDYVTLADGKKTLVEFWQIPQINIGSKILKDVVFSVIDRENISPLLGMNILNKLGIYKIDLDDNKIYLFE
jgi:hypothetical protein